MSSGKMGNLRKHRPLGGIRSILFFLLLSVLVPVLLVQAVISYERLQGRRSEELKANLELARATARTFEGFIQDVLRQELAIGIGLISSESLTAEEVNRVLETSKAEYAAVRNFAWADNRGRFTASSNHNAIGVDISDRSYFQEILEGRDWAVSDLIQSKVDGSPIFTISRAIRNREGILSGILTAAVEPEHLADVLTFERPDAGAVIMLDRNGMGVFRCPEVEWNWAERSLLEAYPVLTEALAGREMAGTTLLGLDGRKRMAVLVPVHSVGWAAGASRPEKEVFAPIILGLYRHASLSLSLAFASLVAAVVISRRITRPLKKLQEHALALGQGKLGPEIEIDGPVELRDLSIAFKAMTKSIASREEDLLKMQAQLEIRVQERTGELEDAMYALKAEILERRKAEEAVRRERDFNESLIKTAQAIILVLDTEGRIIHFNRYTEETSGYRLEEVRGKDWFSVFLPGDGEQHRLRTVFQRAVDHIDKRGSICPIVTKDGRKREIDWYSRTLKDSSGYTMGVLSIGQDITEREAAQNALQESEHQLRLLSARLLHAQEEERKRISREIHDSIGASLGAIKISLTNVRNQVRQGVATAETLEIPLSWAQHAIEEVRRIMTDLRPSILDDLGLIATINWFCKQFQTTCTGMNLEKKIDIPESEIPEALKIVIFRVLQEALHNISKYSRAEQVRLFLVKKDSLIELTVEDNGTGFDLDTVLERTHRNGNLGLTSMKERTELSGGTFWIESIPSTGTTIRASWPCT